MIYDLVVNGVNRGLVHEQGLDIIDEFWCECGRHTHKVRRMSGTQSIMCPVTSSCTVFSVNVDDIAHRINIDWRVER